MQRVRHTASRMLSLAYPFCLSRRFPVSVFMSVMLLRTAACVCVREEEEKERKRGTWLCLSPIRMRSVGQTGRCTLTEPCVLRVCAHVYAFVDCAFACVCVCLCGLGVTERLSERTCVKERGFTHVPGHLRTAIGPSCYWLLSISHPNPYATTLSCCHQAPCPHSCSKRGLRLSPCLCLLSFQVIKINDYQKNRFAYRMVNTM